ncbi:UPF0272 protein [Synergistales bacterium]|nr:UPF0272 protein [Synergistales bacterium]
MKGLETTDMNKTSSGTLTLYLDASAGISGDMLLGALFDLFRQEDGERGISEIFSGVALEGFDVSARDDKRGGMAGVKVDITSREHHHPHRHLSHILKIISQSSVSDDVKARSAAAFRLLAEAEAKVHGLPAEEVHFHEVGAVDSIADIIGTMLLMERLGWPNVRSSPVNVGSGTVRCAHGVLPVPAPATAELLRGVKICSIGEPAERTTPTGALLLRELAGEDGAGSIPEGRILRIGTGLGSRDTRDMPNALRAALMETAANSRAGFGRDEPSLIEANIDDMNPQDFAHAMSRLLENGALDAWCENILMKKGRPAVKLCCLGRAGDADRLAEIFIRETTTLGVRITNTRRIFAERSIDEVKTPLGNVRFKSAIIDGEVIRRAPEYDDILRIADEKNIPLPDARHIADLSL